MILPYGLSLVSVAATEPITTAEAKAQARVTITDDDTEIDAFIASAGAYVENYLCRRLVTQTWDITFDEFPCTIDALELPYGPIQSVTSIAYLDSGGTSTTFSSSYWTLDSKRIVPRIYLAFGQIWPIVRLIENAVTVRVVAGYGAYTAIPPNIRHSMKVIVAASYENREFTVPDVAIKLLAQEKSSWL